ncbi:SDR family oxidoreductase [Actinokineospora guangxiensis]|uniref:SDR family oxidoreductase n=1 Tax=Actinokineospora guangxiensis TaxID=1490288 RepID=A0ABW0EHC1_9PSEU
MSVLVVTGGSRGIGAAVCRRAPHDVVVNYAGDAAAAESVVAEVRASGRRAIAVRADVSVESEVDDLFAAAAELGPVTALVANAGVTGEVRGRVDEVPAEAMRRVLEVNVLGVFHCLRAAVRRMSTRHGGAGGAIVAVSSTAAKRGSPGEWAHYAASKAAVETLAYGLALEVAAEGVRVNTIAPGVVRTELHAAAGDPGRPDRLGAVIPIGRAGEPEEIADGILWLLGPQASFVTGAVLPVSGGF